MAKSKSAAAADAPTESFSTDQSHADSVNAPGGIIDPLYAIMANHCGHTLLDRDGDKWVIRCVGGALSGKIIASFGTREEAVATVRANGIANCRQRIEEGLI